MRKSASTVWLGCIFNGIFTLETVSTKSKLRLHLIAFGFCNFFLNPILSWEGLWTRSHISYQLGCQLIGLVVQNIETVSIYTTETIIGECVNKTCVITDTFIIF